MRSLHISLLCLLITTGATLAEVVRVASGEHANFSRIVIYFPDLTQWRLGRSPGGYQFTFDSEDAEVNVADVFQFIPRTRIKDLRVDNEKKAIKISLNCDCHADAFNLQDGQVVIDIKDGPPSEFSRFESPLGETSQQGDRSSRMLENDGIENGELAVTLPELANQPASPLPRLISSENVDLLQENLLEELSRAIGQGLAAPALETLEISQRLVIEGSDAPDNGRTGYEEDAQLVIQFPEDDVVSIITQTDLDLSLQDETHLQPEVFCPDPTDVEIGTWSRQEKPMAGLSELRRDIVSSTFAISEDRSVALARYYLWLGFGAEANAALHMAENPDPEQGIRNKTLRVLASILDDMPIDSSISISSWYRCIGSAQMWAFLAEIEQPLVTAEIKANILQVFENLPNHLKQHVGPMLFDQFVEIGDQDSAGTVRLAVSRSNVGASEQDQLMEALAARSTSDPDQSLDTLMQLAKGSNDSADRALVALAEMGTHDDVPLPDWVIDALEARVAIGRGSEMGEDGRRLFVDLLLNTNRIEKLADFMRAAPYGSDTAQLARQIEVFDQALRRADDDTFAELAVRYRSELQNSQTSSGLLAYVADRFGSLGLHSLAEGFQSDAAGREAHESDQVMSNLDDEHVSHDLVRKAQESLPALPQLGRSETLSVPEHRSLLDAARQRRELVADMLTSLPQLDQ